MCTAVAYNHENFCFGRTLDYEFLYPCGVTFVPRNFTLDFRHTESVERHYAILGMANFEGSYPLYFDAVNEAGLCMAGLNFVGNAVYREINQNKVNIASFELIPYILGSCGNVKEAKAMLKNINVTNTAFKEDLPPSQLHWIVADKDGCIVLESVSEGVKIYENPVGVLTNNPPFVNQLKKLEEFSSLSPEQKVQEDIEKGRSEFTRGTGAVGLPGDFTSGNRFVRAAFLRKFSRTSHYEGAEINQLFHILSGVAVPEGACITENGDYNKTLYTCAIDADRGIYNYKAYESQGVFSVDMKRENLNSDEIRYYPFRKDFPRINIAASKI